MDKKIDEATAAKLKKFFERIRRAREAIREKQKVQKDTSSNQDESK